MGAIEQSIARQAALNNQPLPERIANAPELLPGLDLYLQAFFDLDSERSHSFGLTRIPYSAIRHYASLKEFDEDQTQRLVVLITEMDKANLERLDAQREKK